MTERIEGVELRSERVTAEGGVAAGEMLERPKKRCVEERSGKASSNAMPCSSETMRTASTNITNPVSPLGIVSLGLDSGRGSGTCDELLCQHGQPRARGKVAGLTAW